MGKRTRRACAWVRAAVERMHTLHQVEITLLGVRHRHTQHVAHRSHGGSPPIIAHSSHTAHPVATAGCTAAATAVLRAAGLPPQLMQQRHLTRGNGIVSEDTISGPQE